MVRIFSYLFLLVFAGCQSAPEVQPLGSQVASQYKAEEIMVVRGPEFSIGGGTFGKSERAFLAEQFEAAISDQLPDELRYSLIGQKPARVTIELDRVSIATSAGRKLNGDSSTIASNITIMDMETNQVIAQSYVGAIDEGARNNTTINGVPVGAIASFVENRNSGASSTRIIKIRDAYLRELRKWFR